MYIQDILKVTSDDFKKYFEEFKTSRQEAISDIEMRIFFDTIGMDFSMSKKESDPLLSIVYYSNGVFFEKLKDGSYRGSFGNEEIITHNLDEIEIKAAVRSYSKTEVQEDEEDKNTYVLVRVEKTTETAIEKYWYVTSEEGLDDDDTNDETIIKAKIVARFTRQELENVRDQINEVL